MVAHPSKINLSRLRYGLLDLSEGYAKIHLVFYHHKLGGQFFISVFGHRIWLA
jgi:hypothetical protein